MNRTVAKPVLVLSSLLLVLSGCRKSPASYDLFGEGANAGKQERVTLTVYFPGTGNPHVREVLDEVEKRTVKSLNAKLDFKFIDPRQYERGLERAIEQGDPCDMFMAASYLNLFSGERIRNAMLDITALFPKYAPKYFRKLDAGDLAPCTLDGKVYGVPGYLSSVSRPCALVREDLYRKYNLSPIGSLDDLERYLDLVKRNEDKIIVLGIDSGQPLISIFAGYYGYTVLDYSLSLVYRRDDPEMKLIAWEQVPEFPKIVERVYDWHRKGYLMKGYFYQNLRINLDMPIWGAWISNQLSVYLLNSTLLDKGRTERYLEFPLFPEVPAQRNQDFFDGFIVSTGSKHPERALQFVEWMHANQENYDLIRYGIKGKHYTLSGEQYALPEGVKSAQSYQGWQNFTFVDIDFERVNVANSPSYRSEVFESYRTGSIVPPHLGFRPDLAGFNIGARLLGFGTVERDIALGNYDADTVPSFIKAQKDMGADTIVAAVQSQLDEWRKARNGGN